MFQRYAKLVFCENMFYKAKTLAINKCIELSKKSDAKIKVSDASYYDDLGAEGKMLVQIDLPGYSAPILAHTNRENINGNLSAPDKKFEYYGKPILPFRMNKEQARYIRGADSIDLWGENDVKYENNVGILKYMQVTDQWERNIREKARKIKEINDNKAQNKVAIERNKILSKQKRDLEKTLAQKENKNDTKSLNNSN